MTKSTYRYFVKPLSPNTNEMLAAYLTESSPSSIDMEKKKIEVDGKAVEGVYLVPHNILTELERSIHFKQVRVYVQENEGAIRAYELYGKNRKKLAKNKHVKAAKAALEKLPF